MEPGAERGAEGEDAVGGLNSRGRITMRTWKNMLESAIDALGGEIDSSCGFCRWWSWPGETCFNGASPFYADCVKAFDRACRYYTPARGCMTCRHYLEGGQCAISLEQECRDGGFEAWEAKT